jgi:hypothetical protein
VAAAIAEQERRKKSKKSDPVEERRAAALAERQRIQQTRERVEPQVLELGAQAELSGRCPALTGNKEEVGAGPDAAVGILQERRGAG